MTFKHKAIYGQTGSGKTWLMKRRSALLIKHKQNVIAWSGVGDRDWPRGVKITNDADHLEEMLSNPKNYKSFLMLDEAALLYDEIAGGKNHPVIHGLAMRGRHMGYTAYFATQYPTSIPRRTRINCGECFCFKLGDKKSAQLVCDDYGAPTWKERPLHEYIVRLKKLQGFHIVPPDHLEDFTL